MSSDSLGGGAKRRIALVTAFVLVVGAASAVVFYLPLGLGWKESVVVGVFASIALLTQTVVDDATFGADE